MTHAFVPRPARNDPCVSEEGDAPDTETPGVGADPEETSAAVDDDQADAGYSRGEEGEATP